MDHGRNMIITDERMTVKKNCCLLNNGNDCGLFFNFLHWFLLRPFFTFFLFYNFFPYLSSLNTLFCSSKSLFPSFLLLLLVLLLFVSLALRDS